MTVTSAANPEALTAVREHRALERFQMLRPALLEGVPLARLSRQHDIPLRSMRRWLAAYRRDGFAGLARRPRSDRGQPRRLRPELRLLIAELATTEPRRSAAALHRLAVAMATENGWPPPSYGAVYALLRQSTAPAGSALP